MRKILAASLLALLVSVSCTRTDKFAAMAPDDIVREFVTLSAAARKPADKKALGDLCAGEMRNAFDTMTDEVFRISYLNTSLKIRNLRILQTNTQGDSARVQYQVIVDNPQGTDPTRETNEREVDLTRQNGRWYIQSIRGRGTDQIAFTRGMLF
jgi:hypothetical protein